MRSLLFFVSAALFAAQPVHTTSTPFGNVVWEDVQFQVHGKRVLFVATARNLTDRNFIWARFCLVGTTVGGGTVPSGSGCLIDLTASSFGSQATLNYKFSDRSRVAGVESVTGYRISFIEGGDLPKNQRRIAANCDSVWPIAVQAVSGAGFMVRSSDRAGGIVTLEWIKGSSGWLGAGRDVKSLTEGRTGFLISYDRFRIDSASLFMAPLSDGCLIRMDVAYAGLVSPLVGGKEWQALPSNGHLEELVLGVIDKQTARTQPTETGKAEAISQAPKVGVPATPTPVAAPLPAPMTQAEAPKAAPTPTPARKEPERPQDTQVVRLPG
jgi:hypothetical protein